MLLFFGHDIFLLMLPRFENIIAAGKIGVPITSGLGEKFAIAILTFNSSNVLGNTRYEINARNDWCGYK